MIAKYSLVALDCPDPVALAEFYSAITGWPIEPESNEKWVQLKSPDGPTMAFQLVDDYLPPDWPTGQRPQQLHMDFDVDDLDAAEAEVLAIGARKADHQPKPELWRVYLDPVGHPFCLVLDSA